jgi:uncharacterized protein (TIGR02996 family)
MSDEAALLLSVVAAPEDITPRLVFTDWLEENGRNRRAAFIRVQCLLNARPWRPEALRAQEEVCAGTPLDRLIRPWPDCLPPQTLDLYDLLGEGYLRGESWVVACGFLEAVTLTLGEFLDAAESLFRSHPVCDVTLSDRVPLHIPGGMQSPGTDRWVAGKGTGGDGPELPPKLFAHLSVADGVYSARERAAAADLSRACVRYGRAAAGLPARDVSANLPFTTRRSPDLARGLPEAPRLRCPGCEFSYGWDGAKCYHCRRGFPPRKR